VETQGYAPAILSNAPVPVVNSSSGSLPRVRWADS